MLIIQKFHKVKNHREEDLLPLDTWIRSQIQKLDSISFFDIKIENNKIADEQANKDTYLDQGILLLDQGDPTLHYIP